MVDYAYGQHKHHKGIFLTATILTIGLCSVFPLMCFKNYSSKEREAKRNKAKRVEAERARRDAEDDRDIAIAMLPRAHGQPPPTPPTRARTPHHRRHRSPVMPRETHDVRGTRFVQEDLEHLERQDRRNRSRSRHGYDRQLDRER
jgi:hypothetical protein